MMNYNSDDPSFKLAKNVVLFQYIMQFKKKVLFVNFNKKLYFKV